MYKYKNIFSLLDDKIQVSFNFNYIVQDFKFDERDIFFKLY